MPFATLRDRAIDLYEHLDSRQKLLAAGTAVGFVLLVAAVLGASSKAQYAVAYSGLSPEDAAAIVAHLREQRIPYELSAGESVIRVPADKVHDVRLDMASAGLPSGGTVGFEIFDSTNLGITDFAQQLNYRRALEGELARTIANLDVVDQARVHIVIPRPTIYSDLEKPTTASVLLKLKPGRRVSEEQILGITHLVSTSVEGLRPENITIVDTQGSILSDALSTRNGRIQGDHFQAQRAYEQAVEAKVRDMLSLVLGPQRAAVTVHAELDWSETETSREAYEAPAGGNAAVRSSRETRESSGGAAATVGGVPGTQSNLPSVPTYPGTTTGQPDSTATDGSQDRYERSEVTYNYELSKVVSRTLEAPGKVKRLSVSVLLDELSDEAQLEPIREAVVAAAGIDIQRGDKVIVESMTFDRSYFEEQEAAMVKAERQEQYLGAARWAAIIVAVVAVLLLVRNAVLRTVARPGEAPLTARTRMPVSEEGEVPEASLQLPTGDRLTLSAEQQAVAESVHKQHQLVALAQKQPEVVAQIVQFWLNESGSHRR